MAMDAVVPADISQRRYVNKDGTSSAGSKRSLGDGLKEATRTSPSMLSAASAEPLTKQASSRRSLISTASRASDTSRISNVLSIADLINNSVANVLDRQSIDETAGNAVDWRDRHVQEKLDDIYRIVRQLFNAFSDADENFQVPTRFRTDRWLQCPSKILKLGKFTAVSMLFTIYALFCVDLAAMCGHASAHNYMLASVNSVVLLFFLVESVLQYYALPGYACSGRFWVDLLAALSMSGDTLLGYKFVSNGAASAGRGTRVLRMLRLGGRSTRVLRILKNLRLLQGMRLLPKLLKGIDTDRQNLTALLFNERLHRLFQYLDGDDKRYLTEVERQYFFMSLRLAFPVLRRKLSRDEYSRLPFFKRLYARWTQLVTSINTGFMHVMVALHVDRKHNATRDSADIPTSAAHFRSLMKEFMAKPEAKLALRACEEDLQHIEHAAELFNETTSKIMIKVSCMVLVVLCTMPFLEVPIDDLGDWQSIQQLDLLSLKNKTQQVCRMVHQYCEGSSSALLFLGLNYSTQWVQHCDLSVLSVCRKLIPSEWVPKVKLLDIAEDAMERRGLQPHEYILYCLPDTSCVDEASLRSVALFDVHESIRTQGIYGLAYTFLAIVMMFAFVYIFSSDLRTLKKGVLLPMWDLLDDMAAMKVIEFARARDLTVLCDVASDHGPVIRGPETVFNRLINTATSCVERFGSKSEVPEEIQMLKRSFMMMRQAMRSWAKYVPTTLVKRLVLANQEAHLGVSKHDVTVMFIDIHEFHEICRGKSPSEVLRILCRVQEAISEAVEHSRGTLLEMIGDEMLVIYNAPLPVLDHASVAVTAAIDIVQAAEIVSPEVSLRLGIHRAEVLAGNIGSQKRMKYGVLGDGVNTAARLKSLNPQLGTRILVSEHTVCNTDSDDLAEPVVLSRPAGHFKLKGRLQATKIWEVVGFRSEESHHVAAAVDLHRKAFNLYLERQFEQARTHLKEVHLAFSAGKTWKDDFLSRRLINKCDEFLENSPSDSWDGAEVLQKK